MPIRFVHGDIKRLLIHLNMKPLQNGSCVYGGKGKDNIWRTCKFDYHRDNEQMATGTALKIAKALGFKDLADMKDYLDKM